MSDPIVLKLKEEKVKLNITEEPVHLKMMEQGLPGKDGSSILSVTKTGTSGLVDTYTIRMTDGRVFTFDITNGKDGEDGDAATVEIGTVTTLPAGSQATVENVGTNTRAVLNIGIPKGEKGEDGEDGGITEAPIDDNEYVRKNGNWAISETDPIPTEYKNKLEGQSVSFSGMSSNFRLNRLAVELPIVQNGSGIASMSNIRDFVGYTSITIVHAHNSQTDTVQCNLGRTVYLGILNYLTGKLTVEWALHTITSSDLTTLNMAGTNGYRIGIRIQDAYAPKTSAERLDVYCNCATANAQTLSSESWEPGMCLLYSNGDYKTFLIIVPNEYGTDSTTAKAYLESIGATIVYKLAEPIEYQLAVSTITLETGENVISTDSGKIIVEYIDKFGTIVNRPDYEISTVDLIDGVSTLEAGKLYFYYEV